MELRGKAALVTGGAHRLGRAIALALAAEGMRVAIHYHRSADHAQAALAELAALGVEAIAIAGDLADVGDAERVVDTALTQWGALDVLVNNSGIWGPTPVGSVTAARWDELFNTNLRSAFFVTQRAAPALRAARGAIVNIADAGVFRPGRNYAPYIATKGAIVTLTEALAKELAPEVRVNAIAPGLVLPPTDWSAEQTETSAKRIPLQRAGTAEDVASAAVYLVRADYVTGVVLPVDGGFRLL